MFRFLRRADTELYSGSNAHVYFDRLLKKGSKIYIISPYIDSYYAKVLRRASHSKKIYIIASSIDKDAARILTRRRINAGLAWLTIALLLAACLSFLLHLSAPAGIFTLLSALLAAVTALMFAMSKPSNISVKTPPEFVHAKIYLSEGMAIQGSANLTYRGMHSNIEHIEIAYDSATISRLKSEFMNLWRKW